MQHRRLWLGLLFVVVGLLGPVSSTRALVTKTLPLQSILDESTYICVAKVDSLDPERPSLTLVPQEDLMAKKVPWKSIPILMKGNADAIRLKHVPELYKRLEKGLPLILFLSEKDKKIFCFAYTNGTWFQIIGTKDGDDVRWALTHGEPYLRTTFKGTTEELKKEVSDVINKKKEKAVAPDEKEKPGFGPEIEKKKDEKKEGRRNTRGGSLFAVIPTVAIGGPLAILALLFPTVFGGVFVLFRRWIVLISVVGINSTLYFTQDFFADKLQGTPWGNTRLLWLTMTAITLIGVGLTWRRQLKAMAEMPAIDPDMPGGALDDPPPPILPELEPPGYLEQGLLYGISAASLIGLGVLFLLRWAILPDFQLPLVICAGLWAGALVTAIHVTRLSMGGGIAPRVPTEGVILGAMTLASVLVLPDSAQSTTAAPVSALQAGQRGAIEAKTVWTFERKANVKEQYDVSSSPTIDGDRVYIGIIAGTAFTGSRGIVHCLERGSDKPVWTFDDDGEMAMMYSSPCVVDGKVFIGEGYHKNQECRLFCLDAATGKKVWEPFPTKSHVESSPAVAHGKVVFGAGDDGLYCLDVNTGKQLWHYPPELNDKTGIHIDASPIIVGKRVYCCSGSSQMFQRYQVICVNLDTGEKEWVQDKIDIPCWGSPNVYGDRIYVGLGNGRLTEQPEPMRGGVLCLNATTGERVWMFDNPGGGVFCKPTADANHVYFGSRDGNCYCVDRRAGHLVWTRKLGSPVGAAPALAECSHCGQTSTVYVASMLGQIEALDPNTGKVFWSHSELATGEEPLLLSSPTVVVSRHEGRDRRSIYFATTLRTPTTGKTSAKVFCIEDTWNDGTR